MTDYNNFYGICLECLAPQESPAETADVRCERCRSPRIRNHPELTALAIAHVDCDAFYAAVEKRDRPEISDAPVIIGGGQRGVVSTACYVARTYGVHSAMPMFKALKACPDAVVIKPNFQKYIAASRQIRTMMDRLTPLVEPLSIDEAFLDLTGCTKVLKRFPAEALVHLQRDIKTEVGVSVSIGLSWNKFLAKLASDLDKPDGLTMIGRAETNRFLAPLPVSKMWGVGAATAKKLHRDGVMTFGDLQKLDGEQCRRRYGDLGYRFKRLASGRDTRSVTNTREAKSISAETTFNTDIGDFVSLESKLWRLCEKVSRRLKQEELVGRVVTLKLKHANFQSITRQTGLTPPSNLAHALFEATRGLLAAESQDGKQYRLIGVGASHFASANETVQEELFSATPQQWARQEAAVDNIRAKFGDGAIIIGRALKDQPLSPTTSHKPPTRSE